MDIEILESGIESERGRIRGAWFRIRTPEGERFRVVALRELAYVPVNERDDPDLLGRQWAAVRGLYNAGVDALYVAAGIFTPRRVGIVQFYGAAAEAADREAAFAEALRRQAAVEAVLANFPQSRLRDPDPERLQWLIDFIAVAPYALRILGHPDPRQARRGLGRDGSLGDPDEDLAGQQNEMLFRGLARLQEDFVFQVLTRRMGRRELAAALMRVAEIASRIASRRRGSLGISFSIGIPLIAAIAAPRLGSLGTGETRARAAADGVAQSWGKAHTEGWARTESTAVTEARGESWAHAVTTSVADTTSESSGRSWADTAGTAHTTMHSWGNSASTTHSSAVTVGQSYGVTEGISAGTSWNAGVELGGGAIPVGVKGGVGGNVGVSHAETAGWSAAQTTATATTHGSFESWGVADTVSQAHTEGGFSAAGAAHTAGRAETHIRGGFASHAETHGVSATVSRADTVSEGWGRSHVETAGEALSHGRTGSEGFVGGFSSGVVPGVSISRVWNLEDDVAERLTEVLRGLEALLNQASAEGGFMTDAYLFTRTDVGRRAAEALIPQAFHGPNVPTPVLTVPEEDPVHLRAHALAFRPCADGGADPFGGLLWTRNGTLLTAGQVAAYTAPGLFEEGSATTVQELLPTVGFYPDLDGDVVLGHQISPETGEITDVPLRLDRSRHFHTAFVGDTGFGKSVAAMRMAYETTLRWRLRTIVLDFGAGWRALLNAPGLEGRVEIFQLWPGAVQPFRWNPLQVGRLIPPETQWRAFCDVFGAVARLGVRRQIGELRDALRRVYLSAGVLVDDPDVRADSVWGRVRPEEADVAAPGTPIGDLPPEARQALAVRRSRRVGLADLYAVLEERLRAVPPRDTMLRGVIEGILYRLHPLVQGAAAAQYAPGEDTLALEDLGRPWGIVILEGGSFMDEFSKAFLLAWAAWQIYTDAVIRRIRRAAPPDEFLQIFFEEANKILGGVDGAGDEEGGAAYVGEQFANMWRDSRKYGVWLHVISQSPARLPPGIFSSCANLFAVQLKDPRDRDLVVAAIARSEKGFRDEEWRRLLARLPVGTALVRLGYAPEMRELEPMLVRPLMLSVPEPTDEEIRARLGGMG
ncbi:MAG: serine-rich protein [Armatimonadota bacterium]|nr:serine-rich protein [Armatimonadota bacterium]